MIRQSVFGIVVCTIMCIYAGKEIELKISLTEAQQHQVGAWLQMNAQYIGYSKQTEYYLTKPDTQWDYNAGFKDTLETVRIRLEDKGDSICYKYRHFDPITKKTTHRDEEETQIECGDTMVKILGHMGYTEKTLVSKVRTTYLADNVFEVIFDNVDKIGQFIEIELKEKVDNAKDGIAKIEAFMKKIGIAEFTEYDRGYIHMIWNPTYNFGVKRKI